MVEYVPCYSAPGVRWSLLPATRLASRKMLIEQNIKRRTGPALYVFSLLGADLFPFTITLPVVSRETPLPSLILLLKWCQDKTNGEFLSFVLRASCFVLRSSFFLLFTPFFFHWGDFKH